MTRKGTGPFSRPNSPRPHGGGAPRRGAEQVKRRAAPGPHRRMKTSKETRRSRRRLRTRLCFRPLSGTAVPFSASSGGPREAGNRKISAGQGPLPGHTRCHQTGKGRVSSSGSGLLRPPPPPFLGANAKLRGRSAPIGLGARDLGNGDLIPVLIQSEASPNLKHASAPILLSWVTALC